MAGQDWVGQRVQWEYTKLECKTEDVDHNLAAMGAKQWEAWYMTPMHRDVGNTYPEGSIIRFKRPKE